MKTMAAAEQHQISKENMLNYILLCLDLPYEWCMHKNSRNRVVYFVDFCLLQMTEDIIYYFL